MDKKFCLYVQNYKSPLLRNSTARELKSDPIRCNLALIVKTLKHKNYNVSKIDLFFFLNADGKYNLLTI